MKTYKLYFAGVGQTVPNAVVTINDDGSTTSFIFDEANTDYQEFVRWCEQGNTPLPADELASQVPAMETPNA
jgi:hypothetical protein